MSTYAEAQSGSYELQVQSYQEKIKNNNEWELVDIYSDQGASGTSMKKESILIVCSMIVEMAKLI